MRVMVSQVDCYKRNYGNDICSVKCPFRPECNRAFEVWESKKEAAYQKAVEEAIKKLRSLEM